MELSDIVIEYLEEVEEVTSSVKPRSARVGDLFFAETIRNCGSIILDKRQTPQVKLLKKQALKEVIDYILVQNGSTLSEEQVYKKINNLKARVKVKQSKNANLNDGETLFSQLMTGESNISIDFDEKYRRGDDGASSAVGFEPAVRFEPQEPEVVQIVQTTSTSHTKPTEIGMGDEAQSDDEDVLQPKSKHVKLSHPMQDNASSDFLMASVSVENGFDEKDHCKHQTDPGDRDRSELNISELKKMVLLKKLDVLDLQKSFYEKAHQVLDVFCNTLPQSKESK